MAQIVVFVFSVTLTLTFDLCSIVCHTHCAWCTGLSMQSFIRIHPVILGDMPRTYTHTHTHTHTHTPKVILIVSLCETNNTYTYSGWNSDIIYVSAAQSCKVAPTITKCPWPWPFKVKMTYNRQTNIRNGFLISYLVIVVVLHMCISP